VNWSILVLVDSLHYSRLNGLFLICFCPSRVHKCIMYIIHHIIPTVFVVSIVLYKGRLHERHRYFTTILSTEQIEHDGSLIIISH
jgi:hypothetical protein